MHKRDGQATYKREFTTLDYIHEYDLDVEKRDIFLFGREEYKDAFEGEEPGVEWMMANRLVKNLRILSVLSSDPILIHMKTNGGDWMEGMAIYQAIKACPCYISILNYTHARSMSSIILQAADYRAMMPYTQFMYHDGTIGFDGMVRQFWTEAEQQTIAEKQMFDIYLDKAEGAPFWGNKKRWQIKKAMRAKMDKKEEVYLTAEETVEQGFADAVFGKDGDYDWGKFRE